MEFRILGNRVDIRAGGAEPIAVSQVGVRRLLAVLVLEGGRPVPADVLGERLFGAAGGDVDAPTALRELVDAAALLLPPGRLLVDDDGYRLRLDDADDVDVLRFRSLLDELDREESGGAQGMEPLDPDRAAALDIDTQKPSIARIYDYYLGGKDNYTVDREAAEEIMKAVPEAPASARANRGFLARAVRYLAADAGIRQFIDIGTGLPTQGNVHEIAQEVAPHARVVYVDNDPVVLVHGRALLEGSPDVAVVQGDLRRPDQIMADRRLRELVDFGAPVGLLLVAILHFIEDDEDVTGYVERLLDPLPSGSHLVISHGYDGGMAADDTEHANAVYRRSNLPIFSRTPDQVARFFAGLDILDPGIVWVPEWGRPEPPAQVADPRISHFIGAVARKP